MKTQVARKFSKLMRDGKVQAALRMLSTNGLSSLLKLDQEVSPGRTVKDILTEKHPEAGHVHADAIRTHSSTQAFGNDCHPIVFEQKNAELIRHSAMHTDGAAGPSGTDAMSWRHFCTAFGEKSNDLCCTLAALARLLCSSYIDPTCLDAYTASRLIPLDKCPGVRPIGVGEVVRRIVLEICYEGCQTRPSRSTTTVCWPGCW